MAAADASLIVPAFFEANLSALRTVDPPLADALASLPVPENVRPCRGRDGAPTFRITGPDGGDHWFGGTSAPTVSGPALVEAFDAGPGNTMLFGIGSGEEAAILARQRGYYRSVLIIETDPLVAALALRRVDLADAIRERRAVLLVAAADEIELRIEAFLDAAPGYICPERMLLWPWLDAREFRPIQARLEQVLRRADEARVRALAAAREAWPRTPPPRLPESPRVAVLTPLPDREAAAWAEDAAAAGRELGWPTEALAVHGPLDCHVWRFARSLAGFRPDWVLAIGVARGNIKDAVAPGTPIISWLEGRGLKTAAWREGLGPADAIVATSDAVRRALIEGGAAPDRVTIVPHGVRVPERAATAADRPFDVAILMDVAPPDPAAIGLALGTQQVLWREAVKLIQGEIDSYTADRASAILAAAERRLGVSFRDESLRDNMIRLIAESAGPTTVALAVARALAEAGTGVHVWGGGWAAHKLSGVKLHGPLPTPAEAETILQKTKVYASPTTTGEVGRDVLRAAASGAVVARRGHPEDGRDGGVDALAESGVRLVRFRELHRLPHVLKEVMAEQSEEGGGPPTAVSDLKTALGVGDRMRRIGSWVTSPPGST
jgi:hypothetical protein